MTRVTNSNAPFSFLEQRLQYTERNLHRQFLTLVDNVPKWLNGFPLALARAQSARQYEACFGTPGLREAVAAIEQRKSPGVPVDAENILITHGAMQALALIFRFLKPQGSLFIVQQPVFGMIPKILRRIGYKVVSIGTERGELNREDFEQVDWKQVAGLYLHSPANPTGDVLSEESMLYIANLCNTHRCACVLDSVYDRFIHDGTPSLSPLGMFQDADNLYVVNSMSKGFGAPGIRLGWVVSGKETITHLAHIQEQEAVSVSGISQAIALELLQSSNQELQHAVREGREEVLRLVARSNNLRADSPQGGTQVLVEIPVSDVDGFADWALVNRGIVVVTNSHFEGLHAPSVVRFPIGESIAFLRRAFTELEKAVAGYLNNDQGSVMEAGSNAVGWR